MARTGAGQSWTVNNHAEKIMFGGVYPTVMAPTGTLSDYPSSTASPWQLYNPRRIYKKVGVPEERDDFYAGGYYDNHEGGIDLGGYWHNGKNLAISWTELTLYKKGKFCDTQFKPTGYRIESAALVSNTEIVVIYRLNGVYPDYQYHRILIRYASNPASDTADKFFLSVTNTLNLGYTPMVGDEATIHSGFDATVTRTAYLNYSTNGVFLRTYGAGFSTFTDTLLASIGAKWNVSATTDTTASSGGGTSWTANTVGSAIFTPGEMWAERIFMFHDSVAVSGSKITAYSRTIAGTIHNSGSASGSYNNSSEESTFTGHLVIEEFDFSGANLSTRNLPSATGSTIRNVTFSVSGAGASSYTESKTTTDNHNNQMTCNKDVYILGEHCWKTSYVASATSVNDGGGGLLVSGTGTSNDEETLEVYVNGTKVIDHSFLPTPTSGVPQAEMEHLYSQCTGGMPSDTHYFVSSVNISFGYFPEYMALGTKVGLAHFDTAESSFDDTAAYSLLVNLTDPTDYLVTEGAVNAVASSYPSQVGVTTL